METETWKILTVNSRVLKMIVENHMGRDAFHGIKQETRVGDGSWKAEMIQFYDFWLRKGGVQCWQPLCWDCSRGKRSGGGVWGFTGRVRGIPCLLQIEWHFSQCGQECEERGGPSWRNGRHQNLTKDHFLILSFQVQSMKKNFLNS